MLFVGLTGGLGCGKSTVARILKAKGCEILNADELGHQAIRRGQPAYEELIREFGPEIAGPDGEIMRPRLGALAFAGEQGVRRLNEIVHPAIRSMIAEYARQYAESHPEGVLVLEAALLLEAFAEANVDVVVVIDCAEDQQVSRFVRKGGSAEQARRFMGAQFSRAERLAKADYVIDGSGTIAQTEKQAEELWEKLRVLNEQEKRFTRQP